MCQPAAALVITKGGEIEVVSQKCSVPIATFPKFAGVGRTSSLMDEELLLLGDDDFGTKGWYVSIHKPRDGLLAMKYSIHHLPLRQSFHQHSSLVSKNTLTVVGGKFKSKGKLSKFSWTEVPLKWENGIEFLPKFVSACTVKLDVNMHIVFGGEREINGQIFGSKQVLKIDTTEEIVSAMKPMAHGRYSHGCQLSSGSVVLVSGGYANKSQQVLPDELYDLTTQEVITVLEPEQSLGRAQHSLVRTGDQIWAIGGKDSSGTSLSKIAEFDIATNTWTQLDRRLHSTNTADLVVSPYPTASLDCVPECHCGMTRPSARIFGGSEAEVNNATIIYQ